MRKIAIVGAGQAGLQLALGLLKNNYHVSLVTEKDSCDYLNGFIMSNQAMFDSALQFERDLNIDFWQDDSPQNTSICFNMGPSYGDKIHWTGFLDKAFQSIDQRVKFSRWIAEFRNKGGNLIRQKLTLTDLDELANANDLTILASGKGELSKIFRRDLKKSVFSKPMRNLFCLYVKGMCSPKNSSGLRINIIPGVGEYFTMPGLSINGSCDMMLFEAIPGGAFDAAIKKLKPSALLVQVKALLNEFVPWEAAHIYDIELNDEHAFLSGAILPEVRSCTFQLASGKFIWGMGDAVILNDPIAGQGANNASKAADWYLKHILARADQAFTHYWMQEVFSELWQELQWSTQLSRLLLFPPPAHILHLFSACVDSQELANKLVNGFNRPADLFPWILSSVSTDNLIRSAKLKKGILRAQDRSIEVL